MRKNFTGCLAVTAGMFLLAVAVYFLPPVQQRLGWRLASLRSRLFYTLNPPDQVVLAPQQQVEAIVQATMQAVLATQEAAIPTFTSTPQEQPTPTPDGPTSTPLPISTPTPFPTAIPPLASLSGIRYEWQSFNNCGPANLAMMLSFWGWQGNQLNTKSALRPNEDDANVMPQEMADFTARETGLKTMIRYGGDLQRIKQLIAAGFPVMVEMGHQPPKDWWMGHYLTISGYDDANGALLSQDSLIMPDLPVPYHEVEQRWWRDFNRMYMIVYPENRESEVVAVLGPDADAEENLRRTLEATRIEIPYLSGRDLFFALYNQGAVLLELGDPAGATASFDLAFAQYNLLEDRERPWRVLWYRVEAYQAYYLTGRYDAVIDLANATLSMLSKRGLEESHYWRGMAYEAQGKYGEARFDYEIAQKLRPGYAEVEQALMRLAGTAP